jgi:hypothetical protein
LIYTGTAAGKCILTSDVASVVAACWTTIITIPIRGKLRAAASEESVGSEEEDIVPLARKGGKGRIDLADRSRFEDTDLQPDGAAGFLYAPECYLGARGRIDQHGNTNGLG